MREDETIKRTPGLAIGVLAGVVMAGAAMLVAGCNTTEGVGEDIEAVGESIDDTAEDAN